MRRTIRIFLIVALALVGSHHTAFAMQDDETNLAANTPPLQLMNKKDNGFRGIWYSVGKTNTVYKVKYGGGLGMWVSKDRANHRQQEKQLTINSAKNHFFPRRAVMRNLAFMRLGRWQRARIFYIAILLFR